jgi:2-methylisocitrate lyase-like PEP mutase family enzyme
MAACETRRDDDFVIIARTDALAIECIEGPVKRAKACAAAGADVLFPDAVREETSRELSMRREYRCPSIWDSGSVAGPLPL